MTILEMNGLTGPGFVLGHRVTPLPSPETFSLLEVITDPGVAGPPMHHHPDFSEFFYICEGTLDVLLSGGRKRLDARMGLSIGPGEAHSFINPGDRAVRFITGFSPRGFEAFFEAARIPAHEPAAQKRSMAADRLEWVARHGRSFGMIICED